MSAFVVDRIHVDVLIRYALSFPADPIRWQSDSEEWRRLEYETATDIGLMLVQENVASVCARYESDTADEYASELEYSYQDPGYTLEHSEALTAVSCYQYQACEHDGWTDSEAKRFTDSVHYRAASKLATGPWEWTDADLAGRPRTVSLMSIGRRTK